MPSKEALIRKLTSHPIPRNFTTRELDQLMKRCGCEKGDGGRGSGIFYRHKSSGKRLTFDGPHPGNDLYIEHIKKTIRFLEIIGELEKEA